VHWLAQRRAHRAAQVLARYRPRPARRWRADQCRESEIQSALETRRAALDQALIARSLAAGAGGRDLAGTRRVRWGSAPDHTPAAAHRGAVQACGYEIATGPEVETSSTTRGLNIPAITFPCHATTLLLEGGLLLRTHTRRQVRAMLTRQPPFALIAPGRVYRCDQMSATRRCSTRSKAPGRHAGEFANLKSVLPSFMESLFERSLRCACGPPISRSPSLGGVDISCLLCARGLPGLQADRLLEVAGCAWCTRTYSGPAH